MNFLFELVLIFGLGVFILRPEDLPLFAKFLARCVIKFRQWRRTVESHVEKLVRDVEVEDFKQESYKLYEENVRRSLSQFENKNNSSKR